MEEEGRRADGGGGGRMEKEGMKAEEGGRNLRSSASLPIDA
jgi:hypothetical protein